MFSKFISMLLLVGMLVFTSTANADNSCTAVFSDLYKWAATNDGTYDYYIATKIASIHAPDNNWVCYSIGFLDAIPIYLKGSFESFFSDRSWYKSWYNHGPRNYFDPYAHPFNPDETDDMELYLFPFNGSAKMILKSWDDTIVNLDPKCANGFMYAFEPGNKVMHVFSFKKEKNHIVR